MPMPMHSARARFDAGDGLNAGAVEVGDIELHQTAAVGPEQELAIVGRGGVACYGCGCSLVRRMRIQRPVV